MTHALSMRPRSWALVVCSLILIALSVRAAIYELTDALEGVSSSDAWLAVGASTLSAVVGLVFLAWAARLKPTVLSWLAAFGWGTGGALIFAGYGNTVIDSAVAASNLSDDAVDVVTSVGNWRSGTGPRRTKAAHASCAGRRNRRPCRPRFRLG